MTFKDFLKKNKVYALLALPLIALAVTIPTTLKTKDKESAYKFREDPIGYQMDVVRHNLEYFERENRQIAQEIYSPSSSTKKLIKDLKEFPLNALRGLEEGFAYGRVLTPLEIFDRNKHDIDGLKERYSELEGMLKEAEELKLERGEEPE